LRIVALVTGGASFREMPVFFDQLAIDEKPFVVRFRRDRRRRPCSPLRLTRRNVRHLAESLQGGVIGVAGNAGALVPGCCGCGKDQQEDEEKDRSGNDSGFHALLLRESLAGSIVLDGWGPYNVFLHACYSAGPGSAFMIGRPFSRASS